MGLISAFRQGLLKGVENSNPDISAQKLQSLTKELDAYIASEPPPRIAVVGECGVGKSTTINALFNAGLEVSHTRACTMKDIEMTIDLSENPQERRQLIVYDMPGLGESI